jgi:hypothetical protein
MELLLYSLEMNNQTDVTEFKGKYKSGRKYGYEVFFVPNEKLWVLSGISGGIPQRPAYFETKEKAIERAKECERIGKEYM